MSARTVALAGSPNVGKSTVFNELTGMHRHTGNWIGKTVDTKASQYYYKFNDYTVVDLPGTYSLHTVSEEERVTREYLLKEQPDCIVCVVDSTVPERSLPLVFELLAISERAVVLLNLSDEAEKKGIYINEVRLSKILGVPVVKATARSGRGLNNLLESIHQVTTGAVKTHPLRLREDEDVYAKAKKIADATVESSRPFALSKADKLLLNKGGALLLLALVFGIILWLTVSLSNYPSALLRTLFDAAQSALAHGLERLGCPDIFISLFVYGVLRVLFWVVAVMLPPMAIFFPLFALLEDCGLLPRMAFHLDYCFEKCGSCGRQALCTCMGLGCNAVGVTGARIMDTPRERLLAILTNSLTPCNGRFPILIVLIGIFFAKNSFSGALLLLLFLAFSFAGTLFATRVLSKTVLKGKSGKLLMELPPWRRPQLGKTLLFTLREKVLRVLLRAVAVSAPAGLVIWLLANIHFGGRSLLLHLAAALDGIGHFMGLDGVILLAFLLGFPANEIVIPVMLMGYLATGEIADFSGADALAQILTSHGWTAKTALCMCTFTLFHFPCSTTLLTVFRETKSVKWTLLSIAVPLALGFTLCVCLNLLL